MSDHPRYRDDIGAYLLGALSDPERQAFERHLTGCSECQEELERLRPAAEALPGSVVQLEPPPGLKTRLMAEVERDAAAVGAEPGRAGAAPAVGAEARRTGRVDAARRRSGLFRGLRVPRPAFVAAALLLGLAIGFGVAQLDRDDETRTVSVTVAKAMPEAGGTLEIADDRATLSLHDMPDLGGARVYQVWLQHGDRMVPARTFEVGQRGSRRVELPDVRDADGVYVTREARGGAQVPSEEPIVSVRL
jgi:anti-sigma-K factor RskA